MSRRGIARLLAGLLLAVLMNHAALAQFKDPTKEELQMTAEPKAPGASAIYLDWEDERDQSTNSIILYQRIKVLTEKGKEQASVSIPFFPEEEKPLEISARVIQPDGTVIPMADKAINLIELKTRDMQRDKVVFMLPSVQVGSILEYRVRQQWNDGVVAPTWYVHQSLFARHIHFGFHQDRGTISYIAELPQSMQVQKKEGWYTLDAKDVDAQPDEEWMPPAYVGSRVTFFYARYNSTSAFWDSAEKYWASSMKAAIKPSGKLKKAAAGLVSPGDSETEKARKIYAAVMALENSNFAREISEAERKKEKIKQAESIEDLWTLRRGPGDGLALLFVVLGRAAGLNVEPMSVVNRARTMFDLNDLTVAQFDDLIAVAQLDGKQVFLDPGQKMCPFGQLYWGHMLTQGMRLKGDTAEIVNMPLSNYRDSLAARIADLTVDETGAVHGQVRVVLNGQDALRWRQIALGFDIGEVQKRFNEALQASLPKGMQSEFDHFIGLDNPEESLTALVHVTGNLGTATSKRIFLPGLFFESNSAHPFSSTTTRLTAVDFRYSYGTTDQVIYRMPAGFMHEGAPLSAEVPWPGVAQLGIRMSADSTAVTVTRSFAMMRTSLGPVDYPSLHDFFQRIAAADQQQIVLVRTQ